jgi:uncharacterized protein YqeY
MKLLKKNHLDARVKKDDIISKLLGTVIGECETLAKNDKSGAGDVFNDDFVIKVIQKQLKYISETIKLIEEKPERAVELAKCIRESEHLKTYLPKQLTNDELTNIAIRQHSVGLNVGAIMKHLKDNYSGRYDSKIAIDIVKGVFGA